MKLTDNQALQQKPSLTQKQSPRRLWLSFIITLFIFASSVSAYFLVKNSQDIRRSAAEPYNSQCTCLYVSDCSVAGMKPCEGSCSPACSGPTSCCQAITSDLCTKGERYCVDNNSLAVCKPDRSGYTITSCAAGTQCDSALKACKAIPTPTTTCQGTCYTNSSCTAIGKVPATGTCRLDTSICCKEATSPNCAATNQSCQSKACCNSSDVCETVYGGKFCVAKGTECSSGQQKCAQEGSASYVYKCTSGGYWQRDKACDFGCNGASCKSACTPGAKRCSGNAIETCNSSGAAWSKQSCPSNSSCNSQTLSCINTSPTCQGTCYTNSSCVAIGKVPATGTCINETSVCCKEADSSTPVVLTGVNCEGSCYKASSCDTVGKRQAPGSCAAGVFQIFNGLVCCKENILVAPGSLGIGEPCIDDAECITGNCNNYARYEATGPGVSYTNYQCLASLADQEKMVETSIKVGNVAATIVVSFMPGIGPVVQIISAANQGIQAYYTCSQLAQIRNDSSVDQATKDQFSQACATSAISAVTGMIGGASSAVGQLAGEALSAGTKLTLTGLGMVDNFGNLVVSSMNANNICKVYGTNSRECKAALANAGIAIGSTGLGVYQFNNQLLNDQVFDWIDGSVTSPQTIDQDVMDYLYPTKPNMYDQITGKVYSPAVNQVANLAQSKIDNGMDIRQAIAQATHESLPYYWEGNNPVPGDSAKLLEDLLTCDGVQCRHYAQLSTAVAAEMGLKADFATFKIQTNSNQAGHAVTLVSNVNGPYGVIDATNPHLTNMNIADYINTVKAGGWNIISNIEGALHGYNFQVLP